MYSSQWPSSLPGSCEQAKTAWYSAALRHSFTTLLQTSHTQSKALKQVMNTKLNGEKQNYFGQILHHGFAGISISGLCLCIHGHVCVLVKAVGQRDRDHLSWSICRSWPSQGSLKLRRGGFHLQSPIFINSGFQIEIKTRGWHNNSVNYSLLISYTHTLSLCFPHSLSYTHTHTKTNVVPDQ